MKQIRIMTYMALHSFLALAIALIHGMGNGAKTGSFHEKTDEGESASGASNVEMGGMSLHFRLYILDYGPDNTSS